MKEQNKTWLIVGLLGLVALIFGVFKISNAYTLGDEKLVNDHMEKMRAAKEAKRKSKESQDKNDSAAADLNQELESEELNEY